MANKFGYKITQHLYEYQGGPQGLLKDYINYIFSERGKVIISDAGYIPVQ